MKPDDPAQASLVIGGPASTLALADDLARLMDDMVTRGVEWNALDGLVPDALDQYWQYDAALSEYRPRSLARASCARIDRIEPAARRDLLIEAEATRLTRSTTRPGDRRGLDRLDAGDGRTSPK